MMQAMLEQRCREWRVPLYISTIDFTIWSSLQYYGVEPAYVRLLRRLYSQQEGTVLTDKESDIFLIKKRNEAGSPTALFTLQHSVAILFGKGSGAVAGKTNKHQTERKKKTA